MIKWRLEKLLSIKKFQFKDFSCFHLLCALTKSYVSVVSKSQKDSDSKESTEILSDSVSQQQAAWIFSRRLKMEDEWGGTILGLWNCEDKGEKFAVKN